jgi:protein involved in polysaccharide export with SLBB domain
MKKVLALIILIIILVAIDWFKPAYCQTAYQTGNDEEQKLLEKYRRLQSHNPENNTSYTSPDIYSEPPQTKTPNGEIIPEADKTPAEEKIDTEPNLQPFGYDLFNAPSELNPPPEVADLSDYILGPGDNIIIHLWGKVEKEFDLTVDREGKIFIPKLGEITAWGLTPQQFESKVTQIFSRIYTDFKVSVSLGKIRSIRIYMTGEINKPGAYTVSSLTTLFNALYLAGGPNERSSLRNIKLIRNNKIFATVDLYKFLLQGDNSGDVRLSSGDAIFVPISGPRFSISGQVKRPAIYEMADSETISQALELAGGPTAVAYLDRLMLVRISQNDEREVIDINLNRDNGPIDDIGLVDGDALTLFSIYDMKRNVVSIAGMVKHPGQFERTDSTTLKSLLTQAELLPENVYYTRANLFRRYADLSAEVIPVNLTDVLDGKTDIELKDYDSLHVYSIDEVIRKKYVYIEGEVKRAGRFPLYDNMKVSDLLFLAGGLNKQAYHLNAELVHTDSAGKVQIASVDLSNPQSGQVLLQEDDLLFVRKRPDWFLHRMVTIEGEVKFPGQYTLKERNETLLDLIKRTGGFTESAFPKGIIFRRKTIADDLKRQNLDEIIANSQPLKEDSLGNYRKMGLISYNTENMNRIIIDMDKILNTKGAEGNIVLQSDDYIFIPEIPSGISVMGAVGANGTIKYIPKKSVKYYVERAGNFTSQADKKGTRLIKADGQAFSGGGILGKRVDIGDAIVIPTHIKKDHDWLGTLSTSVTIVGGLLTSAFIISKL